MPEYQILLLPRPDYWNWVRAVRDYVMAFGVAITGDAENAGRHMAPSQTISVVDAPNGYLGHPVHGAVIPWLNEHFPEVRLDPLLAKTPAELQALLAMRIAVNDRYGRETYPFALRWPTDYAVITQAFGANPAIYRRYGLPGHEGVDVRAPMNANVYACAEGTVFEVHDGHGRHLYGRHVRIQHRDGYQTVYAHLNRPLVSVNQVLGMGARVGLADSTGNSTGSHLHLTLKRIGATAAGLTRYPKDILDPTPYLIWPGRAGNAKGLSELPTASYPWAAQKCLVGVHGRMDGPLTEADVQAARHARLEAVKLLASAPDASVMQMRALNPEMFILVRLVGDLATRAVAASEFVESVQADLQRHYRMGIRYFEVHHEPNLSSEGCERTWMDGGGFSRWFQETVSRLRQRFPDAKFGFPGLAPGATVDGLRQDALAFLQQADSAALAADWIGVHCFWTRAEEMHSQQGGKFYEVIRQRHPGKLLMVSEYSNTAAGVDSRIKGQQYVEYTRLLRDEPGVGAAFCVALSASRGYESEVWRYEDGRLSEIPALMGGRAA
ncbi:MAG TPA: M23 family metallopeptidase [Anaerolineales bacterium]|nr:M23 family metallopeptidase [Anaerolineales bacterium]